MHSSVRPKSLFLSAGLILAVLTFFACIYYFALPLLSAFVISTSLAEFVLCGYDKSVAQSGGGLRVPEVVLILGALCGGTPGLLLGMHLFRHKTQKPSFQIMLLVIVTLQLAALYVVQQ